jgi:hypothetical protein
VRREAAARVASRRAVGSRKSRLRNARAAGSPAR